ncbi:LLM class flavin-dependent oxidoreductase [Rathayibacter toxicus]|uniref:Alkane 1-monooxygenase n=1 Tax=Rathayibacter toxicus TaxID=145458 RepID=A0A0C5BFN6_9MICO|nr:LLM class flavin-dependent oxidoreductase [Rathayibacter toxicus]AJM76985.1 alkane 1-monooxygenase [Rathayibacter toxicus]ALS57223.1 alkane 1-monooxygenase [Rathayibacter toxicus]KKM47249.1 alkane 1-monooxygenase [Rathayibacter toxicus]PPG24057.1 LLM class flavin-dependent oxidoreductase [Rathayibacter toxicus]PPG48095.1 LLM class flavin-dependent oxidoreductase [Rathayibacter toxicus]
MDVGVNFFPDVEPDFKTGEQYFGECLEIVGSLEQLGFSHVRIVEHYFRGYGGYSPNPLLFLTAAAMVSLNLRLITGAVLPAFNHPLKLAGEIGMLDAISKGRLEVGFARAFLPHEFERFGVDMDSSRERFEEGVDAVVRLLTEESVSVSGKFHSFPATTSLPRPTQSPRPPMWVAALSSPESFRRAGERGFGVMVNPIAPESLRENILAYRNAWKESGHQGNGMVMLAFHMYCHEDVEQALRDARGPIDSYLDSLVSAASEWTTGSSSAAYPGYERMIRSMAEDNCESLIARDAALVGDPRSIIEQIERFYLRCGGFDVASLQVNFSSLDPRKSRASLELFARKVIPNILSLGAPACR